MNRPWWIAVLRLTMFLAGTSLAISRIGLIVHELIAMAWGWAGAQDPVAARLVAVALGAAVISTAAVIAIDAMFH